MAANLGQLTLDLIAKIGGFTGPMDQAARNSQKNAKAIQKSMDGAAKAIKAAGAALVTGFAFNKIIQETINFQNEQAQLSAVLRSTGESAGFSQDQLNNMAESLAKVSTASAGDINQAQTTLLAFTGIVGDEFPRALQAAIDMAARTGMSVVSAAETIGRALDIPSKGLTSLSKQGFRFTEDQKKIAQQLEATGKTAEAQAIILNSLEESYGGAALAARDTLGGALTALGESFNDLLTGGEGVQDATDSINDFTDALSDPRIKDSIAQIVAGVFQIAGAVAKSLPAFTSFTTWLGETFAASISGPAADDTVRLTEKISDLKTELVGFDKQTGLAKIFNADRVKAMREELQTLQGVLDESEKAQQEAGDKKAAADKAAAEAEAARKVAAELAAKASKESQAQALIDLETKKKQEKAAKEAAKAAEAESKAREAAAKALQERIDALTLEAELVGKTADEVTLYKLALDGANEAQILQARTALETVDAFEKQKKVQDDYKSLVSDLRTEEEQLTDKLKERLAVLDSISNITDEERNKSLSRIADSATADAPKFEGPSADNGGFLSEFTKLDEAQKELDDWYSTQLDMLNKFREERADLSSTWDEQELALKQQHEDQMGKIEKARQQVGLNSLGDFFGQIANLSGTESKKGKALAKTAAIAQATINAYTAATGAYASASAIPVVGWVLGPVAAAAALAAGLANVSAIKGQAHDGIMSVPSSGTWNLEKGERVTTANTSAALDATLADIQQGQRNGGSGETNINISLPQMSTRRETQEAAALTARKVSSAVSNTARYQ